MLPILEVPGIPIDLLWDLGTLFGGITVGYFLLIFILRSRLSGKRTQVQLRKRELAPMISNFLFFQQDTDVGEREEYIRMKIEIRELLKNPLNREVMAEVLMDLRYDVSGEVRERLFRLYQDLGLHLDAFKKLESRRWERISRGIVELTEMQVEQAYPFIRRHINHRRGIVRKQAQLATVSLREEGIGYFLDTVRHRISEWQQVKLLEILQQREAFDPPRFKRWLISENRDVVLFALRLIRHYRQNDAAQAIITLLQHRCPTIQGAALECIREFQFQEASGPLKALFPGASPDLKVQILSALEPVAAPGDLDWLRKQAGSDPNFLVRSKAGAVINSLEPDSILPTKDILEPGAPPAPTGRNHVPDSAANGPVSGEEPQALQIPLVLRPDFSMAETRKAPVSRAATSFELVPTPNAFPPEEWGPQDVQVFEWCLQQEWAEIRSALSAGHFREVPSPGFLPLVVAPALIQTNMEPDETIPEWIRKLEVIADILPQDSGYVRMLRELLLEDLEETGAVFRTDFIPLVSDSVEVETGPDLEDPGIFPEFGVLAGAIETLTPFENERAEVSMGAGGGDADGDLPPFSIFNEFFRSCDRDSKLILLDEIPEVGGEKELTFLKDLFTDPDPKVSRKARKVHALLTARLEGDPETLEARGSRSLWTPKRRAAVARMKKACPETPEAFHRGFGETEFSFTPDFTDNATVTKPRATPDVSPLVGGYLRFLGYLRGNKGNTDE
jgi:HEAT repeat protein